MDKKHILITYANTGSGHKTPAEAVAAALEELFPGKYHITLCDFFLEAGEHRFNDFICKGWDWLLAHPWVNFFNIKLSQKLARWAHLFLRVFYPKVWKNSMAYLDKVNPDIVFTTHFYCQNIAIDARLHHGLSYPLITLNPDSFETFPQWDRRGEIMLVHSPLAYENALRWGHKARHLMIVPQALRASFDKPRLYDKKVLRESLGLPDRFTLFMSDGGQGIGAMEASFAALRKADLPINVLCICGRNKTLFQKLTALGSQVGNIRLQVYGYTEQIADLLGASDLFAGKGGPASVIEALKMQIPALITYAVNTAETNTRSFFVSQGMAWACSKPELLPQQVKKLMKKGSNYQKAVKAIQESSFFNNGSPLIARIIARILEYPLSLPDIIQNGLK